MEAPMAKTILLLISACLAAASANGDDCNPETLVVYKVVFRTYWDREKFPRQYPEWRPPAQWSKLVGT